MGYTFISDDVEKIDDVFEQSLQTRHMISEMISSLRVLDLLYYEQELQTLHDLMTWALTHTNIHDDHTSMFDFYSSLSRLVARKRTRLLLET